MENVICSYCGAEYDGRKGYCPRCGNPHQETTQKVISDHERVQKTGDKIPRWMWAVICVILAVAVLIGIAAFVIKMGFLDGTFSIEGPALILNEEQVQNTDLNEQESMHEDEVAEDGACVDLTLNHEEIVMERQGQRVFLSAVPRPAECEDEIVFESSDDEIATVGSSGLIEAIAPGETEITVTCGKISKVCKVVCDFEIVEEEEEIEEEEIEEEETTEEEETQDEEPPSPPEVSPADFTLFYYGEKARLLLKNVPEGATITYSSSNPAVVSVSADGVVEAKMNQPGTLYGMAEITVMIDDVKLTSTARCDYSGTAEE